MQTHFQVLIDVIDFKVKKIGKENGITIYLIHSVYKFTEIGKNNNKCGFMRNRCRKRLNLQNIGIEK